MPRHFIPLINPCLYMAEKYCISICFLCRVKLEDSVDQLSAYDKKYETLNKWLKDTEAKVRNESSLKPDLTSKVDQSEVFMVGCSKAIYNVKK